jgi:hypothetical protein
MRVLIDTAFEDDSAEGSEEVTAEDGFEDSLMQVSAVRVSQTADGNNSPVPLTRSRAKLQQQQQQHQYSLPQEDDGDDMDLES